MDLELAGRTIVITGGSRGLGRSTAARLVAEGASVVLCGRDPGRAASVAGELTAFGPGRAIGLGIDILAPDGHEHILALLRPEASPFDYFNDRKHIKQ